MRLKYLELTGFKSFAKKTKLDFMTPITAVVGPNGSGKSNVAEAFRWVLGEQSLKSLRGKRGEDLIFNGAGSAARMNRASVTVCFNNTERQFNLDYDEVIITRSVSRDGVNEYRVNGSVVRLKDVIELLSGVSLGSAGHHIISQGEADRILNATLAERREMLEEALGLKVYHWKLAESEKKLIRTKDNIKQVESLRREIAPHLKFLKKQMEKVAQADEMRRSLKQLYLVYFKVEEKYLINTKTLLNNQLAEPSNELKTVSNRLDELTSTLDIKDQNNERQKLLLETEKKLRELQQVKDDLSRQLGRIEGIIEVKSESLASVEKSVIRIDLKEVEQIAGEINHQAKLAENQSEVSVLKKIIYDIRDALAKLTARYSLSIDNRSDKEAALLTAQNEKQIVSDKLGVVLKEEVEVERLIAATKTLIDQEKDNVLDVEREFYELKVRRGELIRTVDILKEKLEQLIHQEADFKRELAEGAALVDREVLRYNTLDLVEENDSIQTINQEERRRQIERLKIKLEDMGLEGADVATEYKEAIKRDQFLASELEDLHQAATSLGQVMVELRDKLTIEFKVGINKINSEFAKFFSLMFGGGTGALKIVKETKRRKGSLAFLAVEDGSDEEIEEEGIDIDVSLPRKKIKGLQMLSGGERALTSIALLFAMSQVNPPPFLILDETDAALDEANSRKYSNMIENLSKQSQLILITHNRETMSSAGILYGVTMGGDGVSKLLSLKFGEAESYAK